MSKQGGYDGWGKTRVECLREWLEALRRFEAKRETAHE